MSIRFFGTVPDGTYNLRESETLAPVHGEPIVKCRVFFLDDTQETFEIELKARGQVLLDKVMEHLELVEKGYFGLQFSDNLIIGKEGWKWLDPFKAIRKQAEHTRYPFVFYFKIKFFALEPNMLYEEYTRYHFFLQLRKDLQYGRLLDPARDEHKATLLASYVLQSELGDYDASEHQQNYVSQMCLLPTQGERLEGEIARLHLTHKGQTPADAEYNFLSVAKGLDMYGLEPFSASDSNQARIQLGVGAKGLVILQNQQRINTFPWSSILRISFKKSQFLLSILDDPSLPEERCNQLKFEMAGQESCKIFWKCCIENHTFFRLLQPPPPIKKKLFSFGSTQYRYSGRTEHQTILEYKKRTRIDRIFTRNSMKGGSSSRKIFNGPNNHRNSVHGPNQPPPNADNNKYYYYKGNNGTTTHTDSNPPTSIHNKHKSNQNSLPVPSVPSGRRSLLTSAFSAPFSSTRHYEVRSKAAACLDGDGEQTTFSKVTSNLDTQRRSENQTRPDSNQPPKHGLLKFATTVTRSRPANKSAGNNGIGQVAKPISDKAARDRQRRSFNSYHSDKRSNATTENTSIHFNNSLFSPPHPSRPKSTVPEHFPVPSNCGSLKRNHHHKDDDLSHRLEGGLLDYNRYPTLEHKFKTGLELGADGCLAPGRKNRQNTLERSSRNGNTNSGTDPELVVSTNVKQFEGKGSEVEGESSVAYSNLVNIRIQSDSTRKFGFNIKGGFDQDLPVIVSRIAASSPADQTYPRLNEGDQIVTVNGVPVEGMTHEEVINAITSANDNSGRSLNLVVIPNVYVGDLEEGELSADSKGTVPTESLLVPPSVPVHMRLGESMRLLEQNLTNGLLVKHFQQLYRRKPGFTTKISKMAENVCLNRYRDISPYDQTRVTLKNSACGTSYINANHINMGIAKTGIVNRYVAAQGPLAHTSSHFWQMVWEQGSFLIVMLTTQVEQGRVKCHQYWPNPDSILEYPAIHLVITCTRETSETFHVTRVLNVYNTKTKEEREVTQVQYLSWPDHGVPVEHSQFVDFVLRVRNIKSGTVEPAIVHCSAGIGRTGVLILMETGLSLMEVNESVYPWDIVKTMRDQRCMLIQTAAQYKFVCEALVSVWKDGLVKPCHDFTHNPAILPNPAATINNHQAGLGKKWQNSAGYNSYRNGASYARTASYETTIE